MRSPSAASLIGAAGAAGAGARDEPRAFTPAAFWAGASEAAPSNAAINVRPRKNERRITAIPRWPRHAGAQHACPCEDHPRANDSGSWRFQGTKLCTAAAGLKQSLRIDAAGSENLSRGLPNTRISRVLRETPNACNREQQSGLCRVDLVEHGFRGDVALDLPELVVDLGLDAEALADLGDERGKLRHLVLGQEADLQVEVGTLVGRGLHAVLADEHEGRQEDRLDRGDHGEHHE